MDDGDSRNFQILTSNSNPLFTKVIAFDRGSII
jgi:hypothetical protein